MATTVGATLASSKLAVTQGDLHLVGSDVGQLIVQFDQAAFDELLAADRFKATKARRHHRQTRTVAEQPISTAPPPSNSRRERSALPSEDRPVPAPIQPRGYHPLRGEEIPGGHPCPQRRNYNAERRDRRQEAVSREGGPKPRHSKRGCSPAPSRSILARGSRYRPL